MTSVGDLKIILLCFIDAISVVVFCINYSFTKQNKFNSIRSVYKNSLQNEALDVWAGLVFQMAIIFVRDVFCYPGEQIQKQGCPKRLLVE